MHVVSAAPAAKRVHRPHESCAHASTAHEVLALCTSDLLRKVAAPPYEHLYHDPWRWHETQVSRYDSA